MLVVKADAYGHGLAGVVDALSDEVNWLGVANVEEGLEVAEHAPGKVFVLGPVCPTNAKSRSAMVRDRSVEFQRSDGVRCDCKGGRNQGDATFERRHGVWGEWVALKAKPRRQRSRSWGWRTCS